MHVFPEGFKAFKQVEIWPGMNMAVLSGYKGQVGFAQVAQETLVPEHTHQGQWGVVLEGEVVFAMESETRVFRKGDYYHIPAGVPHSAKLAAGTAFIDVWENERFPASQLK
jgi:quercetin dioxygenase-like cupin family protein